MCTRVACAPGLFADAMFQFPNAQRSQQKGFGAGKCAGCGGWGVIAVAMSVFAITGASFFGTRLGFARWSHGGGSDVKVAAIHNCCSIE